MRRACILPIKLLDLNKEKAMKFIDITEFSGYSVDIN